MCRAALLEAGQDESEARRLLSDPTFCKLHTDFDFRKMTELASSDPKGMVEYLLGQQVGHGAMTAETARETLAHFEEHRDELEQQAHQAEEEEAREKERQGRTLADPVFGVLTYDTYSWTRSIDVPSFGRMTLTLETNFDAPEDPPTDAQRTAYRNFSQVAERIHEDAARACIKHYQSMRGEYIRFAVPFLGPEAVPEIASPKELWSHLEEPTLWIPRETDGEWRVELGWDCPWDIEHGLAVYVEAARVVGVGGKGDGF